MLPIIMTLLFYISPVKTIHVRIIPTSTAKIKTLIKVDNKIYSRGKPLDTSSQQQAIYRND